MLIEGIDGFQVAKQLKAVQSDIIIIFLTSHTDMAMDGYEVQVFRFLAKPIVDQKLYEALTAFERKYQQDQKLGILENGIQRFINCKDIRIKTNAFFHWR